MKKPRNDGMTLVEVLIAIMILGVGLTAIMVSLSQCVTLMRVSKEYLDAQWVLGLGELRHPIRETDDVKEKVPVAEDSLDDLISDDNMKKRRYMFEREVDEKEDDPDVEDDGLYVVRSRVSWGGVRYKGEKGNVEEVVRLVLEKK